MTQGPLGGSRPLAEAKIQYAVRVTFPDEEVYAPRKAADVLNMRVTTPQEDVIPYLKRHIGRVLVACQNFSHPNKAKLVKEEEFVAPNGVYAARDRIEYEWTYQMRGTGIGEAMEDGVLLRYANNMYRVLMEGDNSPIEDSTYQRELDMGPGEIHNVRIETV